MNKTLLIILIVLAMILIGYNITLVDFEHPFEGDSSVALIGILAPLCAIVLLLIYWTSRRIDEKIKKG